MRLRKDDIKAELIRTKDWRLRGRQISRVFVFEDFPHGIGFLNRLARLAESMNHHPDIDIRYNKIRLSVTTHDKGGLTMKDFNLARRINKLMSG